MEGFVDLVIKKPSEVTIKDIDDATIVYFSCKIHNAGILSAYNYLNGTNVSSTEKNGHWETMTYQRKQHFTCIW